MADEMTGSDGEVKMHKRFRSNRTLESRINQSDDRWNDWGPQFKAF
jgi:hypothetical protein